MHTHIHTLSSQAISTISQGDSTVSLRQVVHRQLEMALTPREIALFLPRQVITRQSELMPRQPVSLPKQSALTPRVVALPLHRQVVHRQLAMALTPREIVPFPLRQVVPGQKVLRPRQPVLLPKKSGLPVTTH